MPIIEFAPGHLVLGSTTGDLWCNTGAGFRTLSRDLPPIYAVRWIGGSV